MSAEPSDGGFWTRANLVDQLYLAWFAALTVLLLVFHPRIPRWALYLGVHAVCMAAIAALGWWGGGGSSTLPARVGDLRPRNRVACFLHHWYPLVIFTICFEEVSRLSLVIVPRWQDRPLLDLEARLFSTPPTVWFGGLSHHWWITELMELGYFSYFVLLMIVGGVLYGRADQRPFRRLMAASVISYLLCYVVFLLWPTEGPAYTLRALHTAPVAGGPFHWLVLLIQTHAGVHGNAFPSSHVAAGFVSLIFAWRYAPRLGAWLTPLVVLLCLGAVYDRYHYVSDVVAGLIVGWLADVIIRALEARRPDITF